MQNIQIRSASPHKKGSETLVVTLHSFGARITNIQFDNKELALTYPDKAQFETDQFYLGASIGPITNRISRSTLKVHDQLFTLPSNESSNCLHSGSGGFDLLDWPIVAKSDSQVVFELDYDLANIGMHGTLTTQITYRIDHNKLTVEYNTVCDQDTYVNTTNHVYFNLSGQSVGEQNRPINDHVFTLYGDHFVDVDDSGIPTGITTPIESPLTYSIDSSCKYTALSGSVDHHFNVQENDDLSMKLMLEARSTASKVQLRVTSNSPGYQFYTSAHLGKPFSQSGGFCVETQYAPDAINQQSFYSPLLQAGKPRTQITTFGFSIEK